MTLGASFGIRKQHTLNVHLHFAFYYIGYKRIFDNPAETLAFCSIFHGFYSFFKRSNLTDFERFKVQKAKQSRNDILRRALISAKLTASKKKSVLRSRAKVQQLKSKAAKK